MKEINLRNEKRMIEIDETKNILEYLKDNVELEYHNIKEMFNQQVKVITYYLDDNVNHWTENPIFTIVTFDEFYQIVNHDNDIDVFDDIYNCLTKNNLIARV